MINDNASTDAQSGIASLGRSIIDNRLEAVRGVRAAYSNPDSAAYKQRVVLEKMAAGDALNPIESAYIANFLTPRVAEVKAAVPDAGVDPRDLIGTINALKQQNLKQNQMPTELDWAQVIQSQAFQDNPVTALQAASNQLVDVLQDQGSRFGSFGQEVGGAGPVSLREETIGGMPVLGLQLQSPEGMYLRQVAPSTLQSGLERFGLNLTQNDIDTLRQQVAEYYNTIPVTPLSSGRPYESVFENLQPYEAPELPELGNVVLAQPSPGPYYGYNYYGEDPVSYLPINDYFAQTYGSGMV